MRSVSNAANYRVAVPKEAFYQIEFGGLDRQLVSVSYSTLTQSGFEHDINIRILDGSTVGSPVSR